MDMEVGEVERDDDELSYYSLVTADCWTAGESSPTRATLELRHQPHRGG